MPQLDDAGQRQDAEQPDGRRTNEVGADHQAAAVVSVREDATQEEKGDERHRPGHADDREGGGHVADLVDLPCQGDREEAVTQEGDDRPGGKQREVAALERLKEPHGAESRADGGRQQRHRSDREQV